MSSFPDTKLLSTGFFKFVEMFGFFYCLLFLKTFACFNGIKNVNIYIYIFFYYLFFYKKYVTIELYYYISTV